MHLLCTMQLRPFITQITHRRLMERLQTFNRGLPVRIHRHTSYTPGKIRVKPCQRMDR